MRYVILFFQLFLFFISGKESLYGESKKYPVVLYVVKKDLPYAKLVTLSDKPKVIEKFPVAIGKIWGDKQKEGDFKTPEGIYFTTYHKNKGLNPKKHGPLAISLSYPNSFDLYKKKTGHGIWLHGEGYQPRVRKRYVTEGCVAFSNSDIIRVRRWLPPYQGIVVIAAEESHINKKKDNHAVRKNFQKWLEAWRKKDLNLYKDFYSKAFRFNRKSLKDYIRYKRRVFGLYKKVTIDVNHLHIISHQNYSVSFMDQKFYGDKKYVSKGRKIIYWIKEEGRWKIIREFFDKRRYRPLLF